jgi:hypothetical protein
MHVITLFRLPTHGNNMAGTRTCVVETTVVLVWGPEMDLRKLPDFLKVFLLVDGKIT